MRVTNKLANYIIGNNLKSNKMKKINNFGVQELSKAEMLDYQGGILGVIFAATIAVVQVSRAGIDVGRELYRAMH